MPLDISTKQKGALGYAEVLICIWWSVFGLTHICQRLPLFMESIKYVHVYILYHYLCRFYTKEIYLGSDILSGHSFELCMSVNTGWTSVVYLFTSVCSECAWRLSGGLLADCGNVIKHNFKY